MGRLCLHPKAPESLKWRSVRRYMILDLKRFTPGRDLRPGLLWVVEQIPGLVASRDMTEQLARGYWPSYNIPYFPEVETASNFCQNAGATPQWVLSPMLLSPQHPLHLDCSCFP